MTVEHLVRDEGSRVQWWNLFVCLADSEHHREAIAGRPLLLQAIGRNTRHATLERWYRILSQALKKYLRGRRLVPPRQVKPAGAAGYG
jgi:hypothetical protein